MTLYNFTKLVEGNNTGLLTLIQATNTELMNGLLGILFLVGISIVILITFISTTNDFGKSISATGFIAFALALSLSALDLMSSLGLFITLIIAGLAVATTWNRY